MIWKRITSLVQYYPVLLVWAANGGLAVILGYLTPLTSLQLAAVTTLSSVIATVVSAALTRPVPVSVLAGAIGTALTASAAFGLHVAPTVVATIVGVLSMVLGLLLHGNVTPSARRTPSVPPWNPILNISAGGATYSAGGVMETEKNVP